MGFEIIVLLVGIILLLNKKPDWTLTLIAFLSMSYMGLGNSTSPIHAETLGRTNAALVLSVIFAFYCYKTYRKPFRIDKGQGRVHHLMTVFFFYMIFTIILDLIVNQTGMWSILRTQRHWLFLLIWIPMCRVPKDVLVKTIRHLYVFTIIISIIIFLEGVTGIYIFTHGYTDNSTSVADLERGALSCVTAMLYIFMLYSGYGKVSKWVKYALILLMIYTIVDSAVRSAFLALGLGLLIMAYYNSTNKAKSMVQVAVAVLLLVGIVYATPALRTRLTETEKISTAVQSGGVVEGSMSYRSLMVLERIEYISQNPRELLFGVGSVPSDEFSGHIFSINPDSPFDSGDISWTAIVCRSGVLGTILFIYLCVVVALYFFKNKRFSKYGLPMAAYVVIWIFPMSFAGSNMQFGQFWILPLIFANMVAKDKNERTIINNKRNDSSTY